MFFKLWLVVASPQVLLIVKFNFPERNKNLSHPGVDAFTRVDHTCFMLTTITSTCLLSILPTFVDHILRCIVFDVRPLFGIFSILSFRPALLTSSYLTEVKDDNII